MMSRTTTTMNSRNWSISQRILKDSGAVIEVLEDGGEVLYRSCAHGYCQYSNDLWQAEIYCDHLIAKAIPDVTQAMS